MWVGSFFLSVTADNCSFSNHLNEYFTDPVSIYTLTSPKENSLGEFHVAAGNFIHFFLQSFLIFAQADGEIPDIFSAVLTPLHICSKALKPQLQ